MIRPTRRLAAPVTTRPSAPISWSSLGSERQSTERGVAAAFGTATAQRPVKSRASLSVPGSCAGDRADPRQQRRGASVRRRTVLLPPAIEGDQARRFRVAALDDPRAAARSRPADRAAAPAGRRRRRRCDRDARGRRRSSGTPPDPAACAPPPARPPPHASGRTDLPARDARDRLQRRLGCRRSLAERFRVECLRERWTSFPFEGASCSPLSWNQIASSLSHLECLRGTAA